MRNNRNVDVSFQMGVRTVNKMIKSRRLTFVDMIANIGKLAAKT